MHKKHEECMSISSLKMQGTVHFGDLGVDMKIILKLILK
jgi:hypothetical protein